MDSILSKDKEVREIVRTKETQTAGMVGAIDVSKIGTSCLDEGIFPDEVLDAIERRREQIMQEIEAVAKMEENNNLLNAKEKKKRGIEEVKTAIRLLILDIERLCAQNGAESVKECTEMLQNLESLKKRYIQEKNMTTSSYKWIIILSIILSALLSIFFYVVPVYV